MINRLSLRVLSVFAPCALVFTGISGCSSERSDASSAQPSSATLPRESPMPRSSAIPPTGQSQRVGGDLAIRISGSDGDYRSGNCSIDTPLPEGYPLPTPPNAIDIKTYPSVRLAEVVGAGNPDDGMNKTFWPLFNHIKSHEIAMTSPVEMSYKGLDVASPSEPSSWSMAFLYRRPEQNTVGVEGKVVVRDASPVTVIAVGLKGNYSMDLVQSGMKKIEAFLAENPQWQPAGDWRSLYYNGPALLFWNKWAEVQLPVRLTNPTPSASSSQPR